MFMRNRPRMDVVALMMIAALPLTGVVSVNEALAGFADPNVVLIALLFVLGEALVRTGVTRRLGDWISSKAEGSETRLLVLLMATVATVGAVMSSTAVVAIFIPVVLGICQRTGMAPSRLMMPLSFGALISGMMTLVATTPNLIVNAELIRQGNEGFDFFTITPIGLTLLALGIVYMLFARRWLPDTPGKAGAKHHRPTFDELIELYGLEEREFRMAVRANSPLVGQPLEQQVLRAAGINILAIERLRGQRRRMILPTATTELVAGDIVLLDIIRGDADISEFAERFGVDRLPQPPQHRYLTDRSQDLGMIEAIIPADSSLVGISVLQARLRSVAGMTVIGLRRGRQVIREKLLDEKLRVGDTLLLTGFWKDIKRLQQDRHELIPLILPAEFDAVLPAHRKMPYALAIFGLVVVLLVVEAVPNVQAVLLGCLLMGLFRCIDMASAYRAINWQSLILIVGMMPFALALERSGGVDLAASALLDLLGTGSPRLVLGTIYLLTMVLGMFISNTATAILMTPVVLAVAEYLGASPYPFALTVALAASTAFMTPVASPVNTLVIGPGGYRFSDFLRIGVPFSVIALLTCVTLVPVLLPF
jgi:di/tricarboxylate transporter